MVIIAPSLLSARLAYLAEDIKEVEYGGAQWLHVDVMDGHFVPNMTFGVAWVEAIRRETALPLDVHLMVTAPERYVQQFVQAGADRITVHVEATMHVHRTIALIRSLGASPGVALNPGTSLATVDTLLEEIDLLLIMTVNPGFGGQSFIPHMLPKIQAAHARIATSPASRARHLQVDGGIDATTIRAVVQAGATCCVAGSAIFQQPDRIQALETLRQCAQFGAHAPPNGTSCASQ